VSVRAGVLTDILCVNALNLFGLDSLAEAAWDLIPFSFIVDWFVDIGTFIAAWTPEMGLKPLASWYTVITDVTKERNIGPWSGRVVKSGSSSYRNQNLTRFYQAKKTEQTITKSRVPDPRRSNIPTVNINISDAKLLDLALILRQLASNVKLNFN